MAKNSCQKKPNFLEILGTKVVQFWCYTKLIKTKKLLLNWYFSMDFFRKIRSIFDVENWLWKSDFGTFWRLFWPFNKSHEKINAILWSVQLWLQSEMFLSNSIDMMKNLQQGLNRKCRKYFIKLRSLTEFNLCTFTTMGQTIYE